MKKYIRNFATWTGEILTSQEQYPEYSSIHPILNIKIINPKLSSGHVYVCLDRLIDGGKHKLCIGVLTSSSNPISNVGGHPAHVPIHPLLINSYQFNGNTGPQFFFAYAEPYLLPAHISEECIMRVLCLAKHT